MSEAGKSGNTQEPEEVKETVEAEAETEVTPVDTAQLSYPSLYWGRYYGAFFACKASRFVQ